MEKKTIFGIFWLAVFASLGLSEVTAQAVSSTVKIGGVTVDRSYLNTDNYYKVNRSVTVKATYYQAKNPDKQYTKSINLPQGTIISGWIIPKHKLAHGKWGNEMVTTSGKLNYNLIGNHVKKGYLFSGIVSYALSSFKKVKVPVYMPTYSHGDLHLVSDKLSQRTVWITTNGYVELYKNSSKAILDSTWVGKPVSQAKINKTLVKGATRYLYLNSKIKGIKTTRVDQRGAYQYRLTLKNMHHPQNLSHYNDDRGEVYDFNSVYSLGGVKYYTPICYGSEIED